MDKIELIDRAELMENLRIVFPCSSCWEKKEPCIGLCYSVKMAVMLTPTIDAAPVDVAVTLRRALAHMWYAYVNKDSECTHEFELEAVREAEALLGKWEDCMPIVMRREERHEPED